jgi:hypothetical protein
MLASESFRAEIKTKYLEQSFRREIENFIENKYSQRIWSDRVDFAAKLSCGLAGLASAAALSWPVSVGQEMSYMSVFLSTSAIVMHGIANFLMKKSLTNAKMLNDALTSIGIVPAALESAHNSEIKDDV